MLCNEFFRKLKTDKIFIILKHFQTLQITSSILTTITFFLFAVYSSCWINQPEYEWIPTVLFTCIVLFSCLGLIPIPFILTMEIFPRKVNQSLRIRKGTKINNTIFYLIISTDSTNMFCAGDFIYLHHLFYIWNDIPNIFKDIWPLHLFHYIGCFECS